jgi:nitrate reductase gamma subunit
MLSYITMLVLIMVYLEPMQAGPSIRWSVHVFGYAAALGLLLAVGYAIYGRVKKVEVHLKHSHESDWIFLFMLMLVTVSGVLQHVLHRMGTDMAANIAYVVHLALVVPMLTLEVPFSKWSHLAYRPLAMYLAEVHKAALPRPKALTQRADLMKMAS